MLGMDGEELHRLVDFHLQHVADALAAPGDGQRLGVEARAVAGLARHLHVGQEAHLDGAHALAFAGRAAALAGVEAEAPGRVAARLGLQRVGEQLADGVPEADVGGRAGARRLADRGLVDFQHAVDGLEAVERRRSRSTPGACRGRRRRGRPWCCAAARPPARWPAARRAPAWTCRSRDTPVTATRRLQRHVRRRRRAGCAGWRRGRWSEWSPRRRQPPGCAPSRRRCTSRRGFSGCCIACSR